MRAYFCMFTGKTDKAFRLLKEAVLLADRLTNVLDREWAKHSLYVSQTRRADDGDRGNGLTISRLDSIPSCCPPKSKVLPPLLWIGMV